MSAVPAPRPAAAHPARSRPAAPGRRKPHRRALAALAAASALALSACGGQDDDAAASAAQAEGASSSGAGSTTESAAAAPSAEVLELGDRTDQTMAEAAAARAGTFGFAQQRAATTEEIAEARQEVRARLTDGGRAAVQPSECKAPLQSLDFSPILLDQDEVSRVDVGAGSFSGTGTVEVASLDGEGRRQAEEYLQAVNELVADCSEMDVTVTEDGETIEYTLTTAAADLSDGSPAQTGIVWTQTEAGAEDAAGTAQVLTAVTADEIVMVSFAGQAEAGDRQFTLMAEEMLAAALAAG